MPTARPNVVLIFSDNHPAAIMGCSGNADTHTSHLDKLADGASRLNNTYCPNAMYSPCRASVLTGLMPSQHGLHTCPDDGEVESWPEGWNAVAEFDTLPEMLARIGYDTALIGKRHLGLVDAPQNDFRECVTLQRGHFDGFEDNDMIDNGKRLCWPGHMVDFFTEKAVDCVERRGEKPDDHPGYYKDAARQANDVPTIRNYFSQMAMVDGGVGQMLAALERTGTAVNTLVIYTSDHGMSLGTHGF